MRTVQTLTREQRDEIDRRALILYDRLNPRYMEVINVSKDECIKRIMREMKLRK